MDCCYNYRYSVNELGVKMITELKKLLPSFRILDVQTPHERVSYNATGRTYSFSIVVEGCIIARFGLVRQVMERQEFGYNYSSMSKVGLFIWCERENSFRIHIPSKRYCQIPIRIGRQLTRKNVYAINSENDFKMALTIIKNRGFLLKSFIDDSSLDIDLQDIGIKIEQPAYDIIKNIYHVGDTTKPIQNINIELVHGDIEVA